MERRKVAIARTLGKFKDAVDAAFSVERREAQLSKATTFRITSTPQSKNLNRELKKFAGILARMSERREIYGFDLKILVEPRSRRKTTINAKA